MNKKYEDRRKKLPRFGGRCTIEQKKQLTNLSESFKTNEKDIIFKALDYFEESQERNES